MFVFLECKDITLVQITDMLKEFFLKDEKDKYSQKEFIAEYQSS
jgi:hypothetical protein